MEVLDCQKVRMQIIDDLKIKISKIKRNLGIAIIQVGYDEASNIYIKNKERLAKELNYNFRYIKLKNDITTEKVLTIIDYLNEDATIDGILVQLPLPKSLNKDVILNRILPSKDIDGLTYTNIGKLSWNVKCLIPSTASAVISILNFYKIPIEGSSIVILGRSSLIGKPLFNLLLNMNATVTICHSKTKNLKEITKTKDIIITSTGRPNMITKDMIKENAIIIDCSINIVDNHIQGDIDIESLKGKKCYITTVPGGVGKVTVASTLSNVYKAYELKNSKD